MAIVGILISISGYSYLSTRNPAREVSRTVQASLLTLKSQAMANTEARRLILTDSSVLTVQSAKRCKAPLESDWTPVENITLPDVTPPVALSTANVTSASLPLNSLLVVCFGPRGLATFPIDQTVSQLTMDDSKHRYQTQINLGGAVRTVVLP